ncbi:MAG: amidohydrolase family protein [Caldilineaceae bacterium]
MKPRLGTALAMVTSNPARALGLSATAVRVGVAADLVIVDTTTFLVRVTTVPPRLATFQHGRLLVRTTIEQQWQD